MKPLGKSKRKSKLSQVLGLSSKVRMGQHTEAMKALKPEGEDGPKYWFDQGGYLVDKSVKTFFDCQDHGDKLGAIGMIVAALVKQSRDGSNQFVYMFEFSNPNELAFESQSLLDHMDHFYKNREKLGVALDFSIMGIWDLALMILNTLGKVQNHTLLFERLQRKTVQNTIRAPRMEGKTND